MTPSSRPAATTRITSPIRKPQTYEIYREFVETRPPETVSNIALCLIHQANYLLDQHLRRLEKDFLKEGGLRERMTRARIEARNRQLNPPT
jgi:four helix bundle suffix protein